MSRGKLHEWEPVAKDAARLRVPGGWVYCVSETNGVHGYGPDIVSAVFVPDPPKQPRSKAKQEGDQQ